MDVTTETFSYHLPRILDNLANCCFVSLDFEFSGISYGITSQRTAQGPQSLQDRYSEVKSAADKFRILQIGLTICNEDVTTGLYTLKPYNMYLSPTMDHRLEVERNVTFQSSAADFLLENNFSMDAYFKNGVKYLSRDEEKEATAKATERRDRPVVRRLEIDVKEEDQESLEFLEAVRKLIDDWLALGNGRDSYLNIPPPTRMNDPKPTGFFPTTLNRFQKRLVHQLIEAEFPSLVTVGKPAFIQILEFDEAREKAVREQRMRYQEERMMKQTGFRWIAEALAGGDLSNLDQGCFMGVMANSPAGAGLSLKEFANRLKERLRTHRPVIVGHNLFTDLIYFYRCFFGPLPDRVEDFQAAAHEMFPVLMDTKYMATHDCGSINPISSLSEINDSLLKTSIPKMTVHPQHSKYHDQKVDHEAGYDSLLTAQIFIKLSAQLRHGGTSKYLGTAPLTPQPAESTESTNLRTRFDLLQCEETADTFGSSIPAATTPQTRKMVDNGELIPRFDAEFWKAYGNRLRVFGPSVVDSRVCRSCQQTLVRRDYTSAAATPLESTSTTNSSPVHPVVPASHIINAGVLLSRPPQITRDLTSFEKSYFFYQKRLNERLVLPFTKYFYFKPGTPADEDWKRRVRERQTPARDIGKYNAYSKDAWNDELLVGSKEAEPEHMVEALVKDAEETANATSQDTSKKEEIPRPFPRVTEADTKGDQQSLNRLLQRTLYLLVQHTDGYWKLPSSPVETGEDLRVAAQRTLAQSAGVNMNTWMVGYHPVGHHVYDARQPKPDQTGRTILGEKTFFMKSRIMTGQANLSGNVQNLKDFRWVAKDEIPKFVLRDYWSNIRDMLAER
ncbi:uncharacterized protein ASPGLDRAFT_63316 [Aspergillus glaucus CBS 516.65]|uniref:Large ribosomal subunit protein mL46 n=1 Tax=Aspergillus glaucus CBS 516.65 TaxID=1160497 RepID=A0A1L9VX16_ASPGL|nr:hypothetical protein ASPGLDRAFT_63316 [Aspergillus glaucus CBS 516.65]OJJ88427.1 hypothetical protein ASPGLDRAFT_63316 [Aspergillus glaucus CBS 516.65]